MKDIRSRRFLTLLAVCASLLSASQAGAQQRGDVHTLRVAPLADLRVLDPLVSTDNQTLAHAYLVYDQLFALDSHFQPRPQMVERAEMSADGLIHTFVLRPGLRWHDGSEVTADDCIASLRRWGARDPEGLVAMAATEGLDMVDARTFRWKLRAPVPNLLTALAKVGVYAAFMLPARLADTPATTAVRDAMGSGPFVFDAAAWRPAATWSYRRNPAYVPRTEAVDGYAGGKRPSFERVDFKYIPDEATRVAALRRGEIDVVESLSADQLPALAGDTNVVARPRTPLGLGVILRPNHAEPPFDDARVRRALLLAIEQAPFLHAIAGDRRFWQTCDAMFYCGLPYATAKGAVLHNGVGDREAARKMLREAGYQGRPVVILRPGDSAMAVLADVAAEQLRSVGFTVDVQTMDFSTVAQRRANRTGWSIFFTRWEAALQNPTIYSPMIASCERAWFGWPCDEQIEALRKTWATELDPARRQAALESLNARAQEVVPFVPLGQQLAPMAWRRDIDGMPETATMIYWTLARR